MFEILAKKKKKKKIPVKNFCRPTGVKLELLDRLFLKIFLKFQEHQLGAVPLESPTKKVNQRLLRLFSCHIHHKILITKSKYQ